MRQFLAVYALSYIWHVLGVTIGYHRLLAHRTFTCPKPIEYFFVLGGYLAFEGSPIWWVANHRAHHRYTETPLDPHSPRYGIKQAYYGWLTHRTYPGHINPKLHCRDMVNDRIYRLLEQDGQWHRSHTVAFLSGMLFRGILWRLFGWKVAVASALASVAVMQVPLLLNVVCHLSKFGYRTYPTPDDSVNVWWVALLAMGEGWHNNHHAFPGSARQGLQVHEIDVSWMTISALEKLGLATDLKQADRRASLSYLNSRKRAAAS